MAKRDVVLDALKEYARFTRGHRYGGMLDHARLAEAALVEYKRRQAEDEPRQMTMFERVTSNG